MLNHQQFERMKEFTYLVSALTEDNNVTTEIKERTVMANRDGYILKK
jgi:hypothetical protein